MYRTITAFCMAGILALADPASAFAQEPETVQTAEAAQTPETGQQTEKAPEGGLADTLAEKAKAAADKAGELAQAAGKTVGDAADKAGDTVSDFFGGIKDGAEDLWSGFTAQVDRTKESAQEKSEKVSRVLDYLKVRAKDTDITDEEWEILKEKYDRAVRNAYNAGWLAGDTGRAGVMMRSELLFEAMKFTYAYLKDEITRVEYLENMAILAAVDQAPVILPKVLGLIFGG